MSEPTWLDKAIAKISPSWAASRIESRQYIDDLAKLNDMVQPYSNSPEQAFLGASRQRGDLPWEIQAQNPLIYNGGLWLNNLEYMRARARSLEQNNAIASGLLQRIVNNVVGPNGFGLHCLTSNDDWNRKCQDLMNDWFDTADYVGDSWVDHLRLQVLNWQRDGDCAGVLLREGKIQAIPPENIQTPYDKSGDPYCVNGVSISPQGRPLTYWIVQYDGYTRKTVETPIDAKDMLFVKRKKLTTQSRGIPLFANSFTVFDQLAQIQHGVLEAWKVQSFIALVIYRENAVQDLRNLRRGKVGKPANEQIGEYFTGAGSQLNPFHPNANDQAQREKKLGPATMAALKPGERIQPVMPTQPAPTFPENFRLQVQTLGLEAGFPLELVMLDFKGTNYSTVRASLIQAGEAIRTMQRQFADYYLKPILRFKVDQFIRQGKLKNREDRYNHRWVGNVPQLLDAAKELQGTAMALDLHMETLKSACLEMGRDWEEILEQRSKEEARKKELGLENLHSAALLEFKSDTTPPNKKDSEDDSENDNSDDNSTNQND